MVIIGTKYLSKVNIFILLIITFSIISRICYLTLDITTMADLGMSISDEAVGIHDARIKFLYNEWMIDKTYSFLYSPIHNLIHYIFFVIIGHVSTVTIRMPEVVFGILSIILYFYTFKNIWHKNITIMLTMALATNYCFTMLSRTALHESLMLLWTFISIYLISNIYKKSYIIPISLGITITLLYFTKAASIHLILSVPTFFFIRILICRNLHIRKLYIKNFCIYLLAFITSFIILSYLFIIPDPNAYFWRTFLHKAVPLAINNFYKQPLINLFILPFSHIFVTMPVISIIFFMGIYYYTNQYKNIAKFDDLIIYSIVTVILSVLIMSVEETQPLRIIGFIFPFIFVIIGYFIDNNSSNKYDLKQNITIKIKYTILNIIMLYASYSITCVLFRVIAPNRGLLTFSMYYKLDDLYGVSSLYSVNQRYLIGIFMMVLSLLVYYFIKRHYVSILSFINNHYQKLIKLACIIGIFQIVLQLYQSNDSIYKASVKLGELVPDNSTIYGYPANVLAYENKIFPLYGTSEHYAYLHNDDANRELSKWDVDYLMVDINREFERKSIFLEPGQFVHFNTGTFLDDYDQEVANFKIFSWLERPEIWGLYEKNKYNK